MPDNVAAEEDISSIPDTICIRFVGKGCQSSLPANYGKKYKYKMVGLIISVFKQTLYL